MQVNCIGDLTLLQTIEQFARAQPIGIQEFWNRGVDDVMGYRNVISREARNSRSRFGKLVSDSRFQNNKTIQLKTEPIEGAFKCFVFFRNEEKVWFVNLC